MFTPLRAVRTGIAVSALLTGASMHSQATLIGDTVNLTVEGPLLVMPSNSEVVGEGIEFQTGAGGTTFTPVWDIDLDESSITVSICPYWMSMSGLTLHFSDLDWSGTPAAITSVEVASSSWIGTPEIAFTDDTITLGLLGDWDEGNSITFGINTQHSVPDGGSTLLLLSLGLVGMLSKRPLAARDTS